MEKVGKDQIAVVGDSGMLTGFKLAGVENLYAVSETKEAEEIIASLLGKKGLGILIINEELVESVDWRLKRKIEETAKPVVVTIPGRAGPIERSESLAKLIRRALGFDLMNKDKK